VSPPGSGTAWSESERVAAGWSVIRVRTRVDVEVRWRGLVAAAKAEGKTQGELIAGMIAAEERRRMK